MNPSPSLLPGQTDSLPPDPTHPYIPHKWGEREKSILVYTPY